MKGALIALFIGIVLIFLLYSRMQVFSRQGTIDIHLHDTYFVLSYAFVIVFLLLFLGTLFSIGGVIGTQFKSNIFWSLFVLFISVDTYYIVTLYKAFNNTPSV